MFSAEIPIRVRYSETDQMGYVYYGNFAAYYEVARTEAFRNLGINYKELENAGVMMPVLDLRCKYIRPARYDDLLTVKVMVPHKPHGSRIKFEYEVYNEAKELLNVGETTLVFVDMRSGKPTAIPESLLGLVEGFY
ncbi:MAG: 4-hydroxybenzoyl-CoA thioesterase family active site [uncultured Adhaeribacter sp.]|uniref:4-hydroxybenzoyl-CoA thioesterase family active site n=1 Tax=uncultured Adhaeribacter sp. TaxID=448109 RepID=A0A6J4HR29_9BACT|nr:MAG: 4-hydroxybenzoyl-CoA thioesterase family active site [uncultured Adhaeribacter sp.]